MICTKKSEVFTKLKDYAAITFWRIIRTLRADSGGEHASNELEICLIDQGIDHQLIVLHSPYQNLVAERKSRS